MIISASRRTDIPAFFGSWFRDRLQAGFVLVRNPLNSRQVSRVPLDRPAVDALVFWTKNARPFFPVLDDLDRLAYPYYFQHSLNDYPAAIEPSLPPLTERIAAMRLLSARIGPGRLIWRYDPILLTQSFLTGDHLVRFAGLCQALEGAVAECSFKFAVDYRKTRRNMKHLGLLVPDQKTRRTLVAAMAGIAGQHGITLQGCCEDDYHDLGVQPAACISRERLERICGHPLPARKDPGQRTECRCIRSVDIGTYDTCRHGCVYCYANSSAAGVQSRLKEFDFRSPILGPPLRPEDRVVGRVAGRKPNDPVSLTRSH